MGESLGSIYKNKKVLVTGHTGFKGSWLSLWLSELGAQVLGYALGPSTDPNLFQAIDLKNRIRHEEADIRDEERLIKIFNEFQPEFVFHLAAQSLVRFSYDHPKMTYETNVMGTVNVLEAVRKTPCVKVCCIVTSDKCYENKEWLQGYKETDPMGGYDPYSSSKGCAEIVTSAYRSSFFNPEDYRKKHDVVLASVRSGNIIGGGDWSKDRIIPDCVRALSKNETLVIRHPSAIRPWQYVMDPLGGYLLLGSLMYQDGLQYGDAWNFGPNDGSQSHASVEELVKLAIQTWGSGKYKIDGVKHPHEAHLLKLDTTKSQKVLHWKSQYNFTDSIKKTISWYKAFYEGANSADLSQLLIHDFKKYGLKNNEQESCFKK